MAGKKQKLPKSSDIAGELKAYFDALRLKAQYGTPITVAYERKGLSRFRFYQVKWYLEDLPLEAQKDLESRYGPGSPGTPCSTLTPETEGLVASQSTVA